MGQVRCLGWMLWSLGLRAVLHYILVSLDFNFRRPSVILTVGRLWGDGHAALDLVGDYLFFRVPFAGAWRLACISRRKPTTRSIRRHSFGVERDERSGMENTIARARSIQSRCSR